MDISISFILVVAVTLTRCGVSGSCPSNNSDGLNASLVQTTHGRVQGRTETIRVKDNRQVTLDIFLGIPFAKPPVGDLRFRRPVPADPWNDVLQATTLPNSCWQALKDDPPLILNPSTPLSEDCLYLNIWRPRCGSNQTDGKTPRTKLATMIFIHGGSLIAGSSTVSLYNGALLAASECVIVVSFNYRLGVLGFLYLGIPEAPGNMGFLDAILAVKWFKENVENFGGHPNSITIFGNSAGAAIASLFLFSPLTENLFNNIILQSGNSITYRFQSKFWALQRAFWLARNTGCYRRNLTHTAICLKQQIFQDNPAFLVDAQAKLYIDLIYFMAPVVDGYSLTQPPLDLLETGAFKNCSILIGSTKDEGSMYVTELWAELYSTTQQPTTDLSDSELDGRLIEYFSEFLEYADTVLAEIRQVYQFDNLNTNVSLPRLTLLNYIIGDVINTCPGVRIAATYAAASQNVYLYSFNHHLDRSNFSDWVGAMHTFELPFVFGAATDISTYSSREAELSRRMMTLWANFAKYGNPTLGNLIKPRWPEYSPSDPENILIFTESADIQVGQTEQKRCTYWNNLPRYYYKTD